MKKQLLCVFFVWQSVQIAHAECILVNDGIENSLKYFEEKTSKNTSAGNTANSETSKKTSEGDERLAQIVSKMKEELAAKKWTVASSKSLKLKMRSRTSELLPMDSAYLNCEKQQEEIYAKNDDEAGDKFIDCEFEALDRLDKFGRSKFNSENTVVSLTSKIDHQKKEIPYFTRLSIAKTKDQNQQRRSFQAKVRSVKYRGKLAIDLAELSPKTAKLYLEFQNKKIGRMDLTTMKDHFLAAAVATTLENIRDIAIGSKVTPLLPTCQ